MEGDLHGRTRSAVDFLVENGLPVQVVTVIGLRQPLDVTSHAIEPASTSIDRERTPSAHLIAEAAGNWVVIRDRSFRRLVPRTAGRGKDAQPRRS